MRLEVVDGFVHRSYYFMINFYVVFMHRIQEPLHFALNFICEFQTNDEGVTLKFNAPFNRLHTVFFTKNVPAVKWRRGTQTVFSG